MTVRAVRALLGGWRALVALVAPGRAPTLTVVAARPLPELWYVPESGIVVRRLQDGRWYPLDVLRDLGVEDLPATAVRYRPHAGG